MQREASIDEVIIGLTAAGMRRDWRSVAEIVTRMHDQWGGVSADEVVAAAHALATRLSAQEVAAAAPPVEA
jgi:hypothetical protein